ncbi:MAG: hypothetical protein AAB375_00040 [Patescibacteria group bacterium]
MVWQLPDSTDRMVVNAALARLTERWDAKAARDVVLAFDGLPATTIKKNQAVTNLDEHTVRRGMASEDRIACVGVFKIYRLVDGPMAGIIFYPFTADNVATLALHPEPFYQLEYHRKTRVIVFLFRFDWEPTVPSFWQYVQCFFFHISSGRWVQWNAWKAVPTQMYQLGDDD